MHSFDKLTSAPQNRMKNWKKTFMYFYIMWDKLEFSSNVICTIPFLWHRYEFFGILSTRNFLIEFVLHRWHDSVEKTFSVTPISLIHFHFSRECSRVVTSFHSSLCQLKSEYLIKINNVNYITIASSDANTDLEIKALCDCDSMAF